MLAIRHYFDYNVSIEEADLNGTDLTESIKETESNDLIEYEHYMSSPCLC